MYTKSEKLDRQLFASLGVPLDPSKLYSLDDLTKRILSAKPPKVRTIEKLIKDRRQNLQWMALLFRERVMLRQDNESLIRHSSNNECTCSRIPDFFEAFHRRNLALHSQLKSKYIQKLEAHLEISLTQLHQALLKNNFLEQRAFQMEAEVESIVQQHRESFAAHTMMTSAQQRFHNLRSFPNQLPGHPGSMFHSQIPLKNQQFPPTTNSMTKLPELNIQMSQGSLHNNLLQTSDTMGSMYSGFPSTNPMSAGYFMAPQLGFPTMAAMQQSGSLGQMQSCGNRSESSLAESIGGQKKTTLNEIDQLKQLITNMTPREEMQIPQSEWASPVTSESSDVKKKLNVPKAPALDQRQGREKTKERSLSHEVQSRKIPPADKVKPKRDKTPPVSSKQPKRIQGRKDTSKSPLRSHQGGGGGPTKRKGEELKQGAATSRNTLPPRAEELPLQRSKTPIQRSNVPNLGPFSNRHTSSGQGFSPSHRRQNEMRSLPKTPEPYERPILSQEIHDPFPFEAIVSPKFSESPDISSKVRIATEVPVSGEMSFSGSDGSETKGDILHNFPNRQSAERLSRNLSTPKTKLYYKTDTVTTPTSSSPYDEKNNPMGLYKGSVKNLPNYLKPTRSSVNQNASLFQEDRTPKRGAKNIHGRVPSQNNLRSSRNSKLRTSTSTLTKKELETHVLNKSPKYQGKVVTGATFNAAAAGQKQQTKQLDSKKELRHKLEGIRSSRKNPGSSSRNSEVATYSESSAGVRSESDFDEENIHSEGVRPATELAKGQEEGLSVIKEDLSQARIISMSEQSSVNMSHKSNMSQKQFPSLHSSDQKFAKKRLNSEELSEDEKESLVPNFGGGLEKLKKGSKDGAGTHSNSSLSSQNRKNSLATLQFINRPSGAKSPMLSSRTGKSQSGLSPKNGGTFDMANLRGDAHVFSGGEQDSFSFDLGQLEEKINSAELGVEWYCNFDTPNRDRREVEEENDEIKKILGNVNKQNLMVEVSSPQSQKLREVRAEKQSDCNEMKDSGNERPEILSFLEVQKDESMDFETREKLALELAKIDMQGDQEKEEEESGEEEENEEEYKENKKEEEIEVKSFNSSPVGFKRLQGEIVRRDLTIEDPYLLSEPSYKGKSLNLELDEEELKKQFRTYSPMPGKCLKRSVTPTERELSRIPGLRQMPLKLTPRGSVPSLFDTKRQTSPITRNQFGFKGE